MAKYIIENRYITPFFSDNFKYVPEKKNETKFFERDKTYLLTGLDCDGFSMPTKRYKYVGSIDEVDGIRLNSVIMKQIGGEPTTIFSLTKSDCKSFGIEFENGLQLFPNNLEWVKEKLEEEVKEEELSFDSTNLSTYPVDYKDKTIHFMIVKLSGFSYDERSRTIFTPSGERIHESVFAKNLKVKTLRSIGVPHNMNDACVGMNEYIPFHIITDKASRVRERGRFVDIGGCIFIELCFEQYLKRVKTGIKPIYFLNESFDRFFEVSINLIDEVPTYDNISRKGLMHMNPYNAMRYEYNDMVRRNLDSRILRDSFELISKINDYV